MLAFQHRYYVPLPLATNIGLPLILGILFHDVWGKADPRRRAAAGVEPSRHLLHQLARPHVGSRPYNEDNSARDNPVLAVITYGEGYHNFHHISRTTTATACAWWQWESDQVADRRPAACSADPR